MHQVVQQDLQIKALPIRLDLKKSTETHDHGMRCLGAFDHLFQHDVALTRRHLIDLGQHVVDVQSECPQRLIDLMRQGAGNGGQILSTDSKRQAVQHLVFFVNRLLQLLVQGLGSNELMAQRRLDTHQALRPIAIGTGQQQHKHRHQKQSDRKSPGGLGK